MDVPATAEDRRGDQTPLVEGSALQAVKCDGDAPCGWDLRGQFRRQDGTEACAEAPTQRLRHRHGPRVVGVHRLLGRHAREGRAVEGIAQGRTQAEETEQGAKPPQTRLEQLFEDQTGQGETVCPYRGPTQGPGVPIGLQGGGREPSRRHGDVVRQGAHAHPDEQKRGRRRMVDVHRSRRRALRPMGPQGHPHRPVVPEQPGLLAMRTQGRPEAAQRARVGMS